MKKTKNYYRVILLSLTTLSCSCNLIKNISKSKGLKMLLRRRVAAEYRQQMQKDRQKLENLTTEQSQPEKNLEESNQDRPGPIQEIIGRPENPIQEITIQEIIGRPGNEENTERRGQRHRRGQWHRRTFAGIPLTFELTSEQPLAH